MIEILDKGVYLLHGQVIVEDADQMGLKELNNRLRYKGLELLSELNIVQEEAHRGTIAYQILTDYQEYHTRYGALGMMPITEGSGEVVKQLLKGTDDINYPDVVAVYLVGSPMLGVSPLDVALAISNSVFENGFVKNKVMEFVGPGISNLSVDYRKNIDVMTAETFCLTSIWRTDEQVQKYLQIHGHPDAYRKLEPKAVTYYDGLIKVDLSRIQECSK